MADSKPRYPGLTITLPTEELTKSIEDVKEYLVSNAHQMLDLVGQALLAHVQEAYIVKARGGTGDDGIKWDWIQAGTLLARMRRAGHLTRPGQKDAKHTTGKAAAGLTHFMKIKQPGGKKYEEARQANNAVLRRLASAGVIKTVTGGKGDARFKTGAIIGIVKDKKTGTIRESLRKRISPSQGAYEIGRDTGMQVNTLQPAKRGSAGASMEFEPGAVTVGAAMDYSEYFDKARPIIPEHIPEAWQAEFDELLEDFGGKVLETEFDKL